MLAVGREAVGREAWMGGMHTGVCHPRLTLMYFLCAGVVTVE